MPAVSRIDDLSAGHAGYPPTKMITTPVAKTYFNGKFAGVVSPQCKFAAHSFLSGTHNSDIRYPTNGASKTYIEGNKAVRIGDPLADGDTIAQGSSNSFIE